MVLWRLKRHSRQVLDHFSCLSTPITLKWLKWLSIGFVIAYMLPVLAPILELPSFFHNHGMAFTGYIFILSFFALKQPIVFPSAKQSELNFNVITQQTSQETKAHIQQSQKVTSPSLHNNEHQEETSFEAKYERSGLTEARAKEYVRRLEDAMMQQKYYLEADLTIEKLAKLLHISRHHLTQVLNEHYGKNFYMYINEYRIKAVQQQRLREPDNTNLTILAIAYESGFNSKSTFNTVFKKITAMTPSQFRKTQVQT